MNKDRQAEEASVERDKDIPYIVPIIDDETPDVVRTHTVKGSEDEVSHAIKTKIESNQTLVENLRHNISKTKSGGRLRSHREITDIKQTRERDIEHLDTELKALKGISYRPIRVLRDEEGKISGVEVTSFTEHQQEWWTFLQKQGQTLDNIGIDDSGMSDIFEYFKLRRDVKDGKKTRRDVMDFGNKYDDDADNANIFKAVKVVNDYLKL